MTIEQAAIEFRRGNLDPCLQERVRWELNIFKAGAEWMKQKAFCAFDETFRTDEEYNQLREAFDKMLSE